LVDRARRYRSSPFGAKSLNNSEAFASSHQPNLECLDTTPLTPPVKSLRQLRSNGVAFAKIGRQFGASKKTVMNIVAKKIYKND